MDKINFQGFPPFCSCCSTNKSNSKSAHQLDQTQLNANAATYDTGSDARTSSVAELRRKAQEHSAALLHSLHHAVAGLPFPLHFSPISFHHALSNRHKNGHFAMDYANEMNFQHNNVNNNSVNDNNNVISKTEPTEKQEFESSKSCNGD